ncbi:MAG: hypothetical protein ACOYEJ_00185 [Mahellales bacterium]
MNILTNMQVSIDKEGLYKQIGYKDISAIAPAVKESIEQLISYGLKLIEPKLAVKRCDIEVQVDKNRILIEGDIYFNGEFITKHLKNCTQIVIFLATVGPTISKEIDEAFKENDYLKAMVLDGLADRAIENIIMQYWNQLVEDIQAEGLGITGFINPGHLDFGVDQQRAVFKILDGSKIGLSLTDSCLIMPIKSASGLFGLGKGIGISKDNHNCQHCTIKDCPNRSSEYVISK